MTQRFKPYPFYAFIFYACTLQCGPLREITLLTKEGCAQALTSMTELETQLLANQAFFQDEPLVDVRWTTLVQLVDLPIEETVSKETVNEQLTQLIAKFTAEKATIALRSDTKLLKVADALLLVLCRYKYLAQHGIFPEQNVCCMPMRSSLQKLRRRFRGNTQEPVLGESLKLISEHNAQECSACKTRLQTPQHRNLTERAPDFTDLDADVAEGLWGADQVARAKEQRVRATAEAKGREDLKALTNLLGISPEGDTAQDPSPQASTTSVDIDFSSGSATPPHKPPSAPKFKPRRLERDEDI